MLKHDLTNWPDNPNLDGLLLFAQSVEEMLFDHTLDSYQVPALNVHTLLLETQFVLSLIKARRFRQGTLNSVLEELVYRISQDKAMRSCLGIRFESVMRALNSHDSRSVSSIVDYVVEACEEGAYRQHVVSELARAVEDPKRKDDIIDLARSLVVELLYEGYSREHVYFSAQEFFFHRPGHITSTRDLQQFLSDRFTFDKREWVVVARASASYDSDPSIQASDITVSREVPESRGRTAKERDRERKFFAPDEGYPVYVTVTTHALDASGARDVLKSWLRAVGAFRKQADHRQAFDFRGEMLVYEQPSNRCLLVRDSTPPLLKGSTQPLRISSMTSAVGIVRKVPEYYRMTDLHLTALQSEEADTQFLTLWTALEGLLPETRGARIRGITLLLESVLCRKYIGRLLRNLQDDLQRCVPGSLSLMLSSSSVGTSPSEKLAAAISIESFKPLRDILYKGSSDARNVLLCNRVWNLKRSLSSPDSIRLALSNHWRRVSWHLSRMYRSRNLLVHSGTKLPYLESLVQNLHSYLDTLMDSIADAFEEVPHFESVESALHHVSLEYEGYQKYLNDLVNGKSAIDQGNYRQALHIEVTA